MNQNGKETVRSHEYGFNNILTQPLTTKNLFLTKLFPIMGEHASQAKVTCCGPGQMQLLKPVVMEEGSLNNMLHLLIIPNGLWHPVWSASKNFPKLLNHVVETSDSKYIPGMLA